MATYFSLFPLTTYGGKTCVDITRRVAITSTIQADPRAYAPLEVRGGQRADQVALAYYGADDREWLVLMSTEVLDPYYDWFLSDPDFISHVVDKYGSIPRALSRVHHWELAWTEGEIDSAGWEALADSLKRYYVPNLGPNGRVMSYSIRQDDLSVSTNMIVSVGVDDATSFSREVVRTGAGTAEVAWSNSSSLTLQHVQADLSPGTVLTGMDSGSSATVSSLTYVSNTIPIDERVYWEPVTNWDYENQKNESRKNVRLIDARYASAIETQLRDLLNR